MCADFDGTEIKEDPLRILQYLKKRFDQGNPASVKQIMDETGLGRGSVHNYLTGTLGPERLAGVYETIPQSGAAADKQLWTVTDIGYNWLEELDPVDLPQTIGTSEAVETARDARELASDAKGVANAVSERVGSLTDDLDEISGNLDSQRARINDVTDGQDSLHNEVSTLADDLEKTQTDTTQQYNELTEDLNEITEQVEELSEDLEYYTQVAMANKENLVGTENDESGVRGSVNDLDSTVNRWRKITIGTGAIAVVAVIAVIVLLI